MDVNALLLLVQVVDAGSLAEAARRTGVPKSTLSRKLRELEESLGVRLLQRTSRRLGLTDAGRRLLAHGREVHATVRAAEREVRPRGEEVAGRLRVTMSVSFAERLVSPLIVEFLQRYPKVELELRLDPVHADLIVDEIDVALRVGRPDPKSPLIARRFGDAAVYPVASPAYLRRHGEPSSMDDLREHAGIVYRPARSGAGWMLELPGEPARRVTPRSRLLVNSHPLGREAALAGLGVACVPANFIRADIEQGTLKRVLAPMRSPLMWVYAAYPSRELPLAARTLIDFLAERLDVASFTLPE